MFTVLQLPAQAPKHWKKATKEFQKKLNDQYADPEESPLDSIDRIHFKRHEFFRISKSYLLEAEFVRTPNAQSFEIPTSSGRSKTFVKYGELHFVLNGKADTLSAYQNLKLLDSPIYSEYLFIPFRDHTSGFESYGGGRYIDWQKPEKEGKVYLDLNQCYNPYCAYSTGWNCPIPPDENYINQKVLAGVKSWKSGH